MSNMNRKTVKFSIDIKKQAVVVEIDGQVSFNALDEAYWSPEAIKKNLLGVGGLTVSQLNYSTFELVHQLKASKDLNHDLSMYAQHRRSCINYSNPSQCNCGLNTVLERCDDYE